MALWTLGAGSVSKAVTRNDDVARSFDFVIRPTAAIALPCVWFLAWLLMLACATAKFPIGDAPLRVISGAQLAVVSCIDAVLLAALVVDGLSIRRRPPFARRGPLVGVVICMLSVVVLQVGAMMAFSPVTWAH